MSIRHDLRKDAKTGIRPPASLTPRYSPLVLKLLLILKVPQRNLIDELCPDQPKSILAKARDIARNLAEWTHYAQSTRNASWSMADGDHRLDGEFLERLRVATQEAQSELAPLAGNGVEKHSAATRHYHKLLAVVKQTRDVIKLHCSSPAKNRPSGRRKSQSITR